MQLEELQQEWRRLDKKLDKALALHTELVRRLVVQPARRRVNRLAVWPAIDVAFCVGVLLLGAAFLSAYGRDGRLLAPAATVMIGALVLLADSIRQLERVARLDWSGPVAEIQGSLDQLRVARIRQFKWIILLAPLMGFCALLVGLHWIFGSLFDDRADILAKLDPWWMVANYVFGVLFVPLGYLAARALAKRCQGRPWWRRVLDDISGSSLNAAAQDLKRWTSLKAPTLRPGD